MTGAVSANVINRRRILFAFANAVHIVLPSPEPGNIGSVSLCIAIAGDFKIRLDSAPERMIQTFQHQHSSPFGNYARITIAIEWPARTFRTVVSR